MVNIKFQNRNRNWNPILLDNTGIMPVKWSSLRSIYLYFHADYIHKIWSGGDKKYAYIHSYMQGLKTRAYYLLCSQKSIPIKINTVKFNKRKKKDGLDARGSENEDGKKKNRTV